MTTKTLDALVSGTIDVIKKSLEPRDVRLRALESRVIELQQEVLDLTSLVHLLHGKVDPPTAAAVRDVH